MKRSWDIFESDATEVLALMTICKSLKHPTSGLQLHGNDIRSDGGGSLQTRWPHRYRDPVAPPDISAPVSHGSFVTSTGPARPIPRPEDFPVLMAAPGPSGRLLSGPLPPIDVPGSSVSSNRLSSSNSSFQRQHDYNLLQDVTELSRPCEPGGRYKLCFDPLLGGDIQKLRRFLNTRCSRQARASLPKVRPNLLLPPDPTRTAIGSSDLTATDRKPSHHSRTAWAGDNSCSSPRKVEFGTYPAAMYRDVPRTCRLEEQGRMNISEFTCESWDSQQPPPSQRISPAPSAPDRSDGAWGITRPYAHLDSVSHQGGDDVKLAGAGRFKSGAYFYHERNRERPITHCDPNFVEELPPPPPRSEAEVEGVPVAVLARALIGRQEGRNAERAPQYCYVGLQNGSLAYPAPVTDRRASSGVIARPPGPPSAVSCPKRFDIFYRGCENAACFATVFELQNNGWDFVNIPRVGSKFAF
eukprot:284817589_4